jgi:insertion element IS1 protein InsB
VAKKVFRPLADTIRLSAERPILELDELWSFVGTKATPVWIWLAIERQTGKVVGVAFADRSTTTPCWQLGLSLPPDYRKRAILYTDEWEAYANVLPSKRIDRYQKSQVKQAILSD